MESNPQGQKLDFSNTKFAFAYKSDAQLKRTYRFFKMLGSNFLAKIGPPLVTFALKIRLPVEGIIRKTIFDIFCGGTSLEDTSGRSAELFRSKVLTILDYSVEGKSTEASFDATRDEIIRTLQHGAVDAAVAFSAMKVTGIADAELLSKLDGGRGLEPDEKAAIARGKARLQAICQVAFDLGQPVFVDAEETWIQKTIDTWTEEMMATYNKQRAIVYQTVQMYRHDRLAYLRGLIQKAKDQGHFIGIKVVRGAYIEKENARALELGYPTPMQPNKAATDRDYNAALRECMAHIGHVAICAGTHNEESAALLAVLIDEKGIPRDHPHVLFAQLLGMSDHISFNLAHNGYRSAKYLPYGPVKSVLPYLFRRAAENTSIAGQSGREVELLRKEVLRRGLL
ncbi:MAG TPA: proline dehydrogenase family protein [Bacteroidia bacterium]|nr:proline dehydrogenase family protein [Bacteroidia bacterium]